MIQIGDDFHFFFYAKQRNGENARVNVNNTERNVI